MIFEFDDVLLKTRYVRPEDALAIRDAHDRDMEYDGAMARLRMEGYRHVLRYNYSEVGVAQRHFSRNLAGMNIPFGDDWTAFWCYRRGEGVRGKTFVGFKNQRDAILFKLFWLKNNVEA